MSRAAVFFDRDNTLIANDGYLGDPSGVVLIHGAADAIARARALGFAVVTFSNQSGVARGMFAEEAVHSVNSRLDEMLLDQHANARIDRHEFCPYHPEAVVERYKKESELRKPRPGMILQAAGRLNLDLSKSWVIGDAPRDIEAGKAGGCRTILFSDPSVTPSSAAEEASTAKPDFVVTSLEDALDLIEQNMLSDAHEELNGGKSGNGDRKPEAAEDHVATEATEAIASADATHATDATELTDSAETRDAMEANDATEAAEASDAIEATPSSKATPDAPARAAPPRKMTFAERVKSGTFQPARSASASGVVHAERPKRAAAATSESAAPSDPSVRPTEPVSDSELIEPLLQQILEEVRLMRQQHPGTEFAVPKLLAGIVQVLVLPALFFAYLHRDVAADLQSLLLLATFLQVLTIALLIMGRQQ